MPGRDGLPMRLGEMQINGLRSLIQAAPYVEAIASGARSAESGVTMMSLSEKLGSQIGLPEEDVFDVLVALWNLRKWQETRGDSEEEFVKSLSATVTKQMGDVWLPADIENWNGVAKALGPILSSLSVDHPISVSYKAQRLAYSHQNILMDARIITDFRPVFDDAGERILEVIILHRLSIQYATGHSEPSVIEFALDSQDLGFLHEACARAEHKIEISLAALKDLKPVLFPDGWGE